VRDALRHLVPDRRHRRVKRQGRGRARLCSLRRLCVQR
jgi:hypothetical protein